MSELLQVNLSVDGCEKPSTEEVMEMVKHPSELALSRARQFGMQIPSQNQAKAKTQNQLFQDFLHEQQFYYYDEVVRALHGSEADVAGLLEKSCERNPWMAVQWPNIVETYLGREAKQEFFRSVVMQRRDYHDFDKFAYELDDHRLRTQFANRIVIETGKQPLARAFISPLHEANAFTDSEKAQLFDQALKYPYFYNGFPQVSYIGGSDASDAEGSSTILRSLQGLIDAGITSHKAIQDNIDARKDGKLHDDSHYMKQSRKEAALAECMFKLAGILPADDGLTVTGVIKDFVGFLQENKNDYFKKVDVYPLVDLVKLKLAEPGDIVPLLTDIDGENKSGTYVEEFNYRLRIDQENEQFAYELHTDSDETVIDEYYQRYIVDGDVELNHDNAPNFHRDVVEYQGSQPEKARQLIEKGPHCLTNIRYGDNHEPVIQLFEGSLDRLQPIIRYLMNREDDHLNYNNWRLYAELADVSEEEMRTNALEWLGRCTDIYSTIHALEQTQDFEDPLLDAETCMQILVKKIKSFEVGYHDVGSINRFCSNYMGSELTKTYIYPLIDQIPQLNSSGVYYDVTHDSIITDKDYYDLYEQAFSMYRTAHMYGKKATDEFIEKLLTTLATEQLVDVLWYTWAYMDNDQKQQAVERIYDNPALAAMEFSAKHIQVLVSELGHNRSLTEAKPIDKLQELAPKAYATMSRRLKAKDLSYEEMIDRQDAESIFPPQLESSRANIFINYAYYYDLCDRLKAFDGAKDLVGRVRGKFTEKNELQALELLVLLNESAGVTGKDQVEELSKPELEQLALQSVLARAGLDQAEQIAAYENFTKQGAEVVKLAMWLHVSFRSDKLRDYLADFLKYSAAGNSIEDWKLHHQRGNNLPDALDQSQQADWLSEYSKEFKAGDIKGEIAFTNNLNALLLCGVRPIQNCLHYGYGLNQRALAGVLNADTKLLNITNKNGNPIGNAIVRIAIEAKQPVIIVEPLYVAESDGYKKAEIHRTVIAHAEAYAESIGLPLRIARVEKYGKEITTAASLMWSGSETEDRTVVQGESKAPFTYADTNGVSSKMISSQVLSKK